MTKDNNQGVQFALTFGLMGPPLKTQLRTLGAKMAKEKIEYWQKRIDAMNIVRMQSLFPDAQIGKAYRKLLDKISDDVTNFR